MRLRLRKREFILKVTFSLPSLSSSLLKLPIVSRNVLTCTVPSSSAEGIVVWEVILRSDQRCNIFKRDKEQTHSLFLSDNKLWSLKCKTTYSFMFSNLWLFIEDAFLEANGVHEREATALLSQYLSKLKFTDAQGLVLPREKLPQGYLFNHNRCSKRTRYTPSPGFSMVVSREVTWISDGNEEETRKTVRMTFSYFLKDSLFPVELGLLIKSFQVRSILKTKM